MAVGIGSSDIPRKAIDASFVQRLTLGIRDNGALLAILGLAAFLNFWNLSANGYGNSYYAAAVRSMTQSWHNFFFASFDPGGFITVDKPPVGLWVQAASAKLFGYSGFSILLPEALAGVAAVLILYLTISRVFGRTAGLVAGLALAVTPIAVAINRSNNLDAWLALCTVVAAYCVVRAIENGSLRWLVLCGVMIGVAFNTKTLAGFVAAPALFGAYALTAPVEIKRRLLNIVIAGGVLLAVSASWVAAVDLTPAGSRPYVGGSQENSELDLLLNYNGLGRIDGEGNGPGGGMRPPTDDTTLPLPDGLTVPPFGNLPPNGVQPMPNGAAQPEAGAPPAPNGIPQQDDGGMQMRGPGGPGGAGFGGGAPGLMRLFKDELSAQASWLLPLALIGGPASLLSFERRLSGNLKLGTLIVFGGWLLIAGAVFSKAEGIFHPYYLAYIGPAIGGVVGISVATFGDSLRRRDWRALFLPLAFIATAVFELGVIEAANGYARWLTPVVIAGVAAACLAFVGAMLLPKLRRLAGPALAVALAAVLLPPAVWSYSVIGESGNAALPYVSPGASTAGFPGGGRAPGETTTNEALVQYLRDNRGNARWLAATESSMSASGVIIATGEPVLAMGGFSGGDPAVTVEGVARMVESGELRFILAGGMGGPGGMPGATGAMPGASYGVPRADTEPRTDDGAAQRGGNVFAGPGGRGGASTVTSAITSSCTAVDPALYGGASGGSGFNRASQLYDCQGKADAIRQAGAQP